MIQPRNSDEVAYVHNLAAFLIRAQDQVEGGDKPGSVRFTDAFRSLKTWGESRYPQDNGGLVEWAQMLAQEDPRNDRLVAFLAEQDTRMKPVAEPEPAPVTVTGEAKAGPYPVRAADPPPVPTTLANVVQRPSDKKSDKPEPKPEPPKEQPRFTVEPEPKPRTDPSKPVDKPALLQERRPAPVAPTPPHHPSPVLPGNSEERTAKAQQRKRKTVPKKETP